MHRLRSLLRLPVAISFAVACGENTGPNPVEQVAGTYHATTIQLITGGDPSVLVDALELGASAEIVLTLERTTTGTLIIPAVLTEDGVDEDVFDLAGTFTVSGNTVMFQGQGDNIFPAVPWTRGDGTLTASFTDSEGTTQVTLTRS
jgi:hypothetical protein